MGAGMTTKTVIVGAGPAGLAVAAMLGQRGVTYTVLERADRVGALGVTATTVCSCIRAGGFPHYPAPRSPDAMVPGSAEMILLHILSSTRTDFGLIPSSGSRSGGSSERRGAGGFRPRPATARRTRSFSRPAAAVPPTSRTGRASTHFLDRSGTRWTIASPPDIATVE